MTVYPTALFLTQNQAEAWKQHSSKATYIFILHPGQQGWEKRMQLKITISKHTLPLLKKNQKPKKKTIQTKAARNILNIRITGIPCSLTVARKQKLLVSFWKQG